MTKPNSPVCGFEDLRGAADDGGHYWILKHSRPLIEALPMLRVVT